MPSIIGEVVGSESTRARFRPLQLLLNFNDTDFAKVARRLFVELGYKVAAPLRVAYTE